jgi:formyltetrahydrofolate hydrolase
MICQLPVAELSKGDIVAVVSNHGELEGVAGHFGVALHHLPTVRLKRRVKPHKNTSYPSWS